MSILHIIGRENELSILENQLEATCKGHGGTVIVSGEPGMGKTTLVNKFLDELSEDVQLLSGAALAESAQPFQMFSRALGEGAGKPLFEEHEFQTFTELFAIDRAGILVAQAAPDDDGLDADIFAGMFAAVQDFVRDSFDSSGDMKGSLGRLEYGNMKIIIEHGPHIFLVAVFRGTEHRDMKSSVKNTLEDIEEKYGDLLEGWSGNIEEAQGIQEEIGMLAKTKFLVRKSLDGINLEQERTRISEEVLQIVSRISQDNTVMILLEDLHWADESSIFVLNYLARNIRTKNVFILGTLRPGEGQNVLDALETVRKEGAVSLLELGRFNTGNIKNLIENLYPNHRLPEEFLDKISSQSSGNPFFATELLKALEDSGNIIQRDGKYYLEEHDFSMPSSIEEVVYHRVETLEPEALALVEFASCIGREFDKKILLDSDTIKAPEQTITMLKDMGILTCQNQTEQFSHALFQSVVYDSLSSRWKTLYHKEIGEWYEDNYSNRLNDIVFELARHFSLTREHDKTFEYNKLAGEKAEDSFSPDLAVNFYNTAINVIPKLRLGAAGNNQEFDLLERLGEINGLQGYIESTLENYSKALDAAPDDVSRARIHRRMAYTMTSHGQFDDALEVLEKAEKLLEGKEHDEQGFIQIARSFVNLNKGNFNDTIEMAKIGIEILQGTDDKEAKRTAGMAWKIQGVCYLLMGNYKESLRTHGMGKKIGEELNDPYGLSAAYNNIGNVYLSMGEYPQALEHYNKALELLEKTKDMQGKSYTLNNIGIINKNMGKYDRAREYYEECLITMEKLGDLCGMASAYNNIGNILSEQGKHKEAMIPYEKGLGIARKIGDKQQMVNNLCEMAGTRARVGELEKAEAEANEALGISQEIGSKRTEMGALRGLILIHSMNNKLEKAEEAFEKAMVGFKELGMDKEIAKTLMDFGEMLAIYNGKDAAREKLKEAKQIFLQVKMDWYAKDCDKLLQEL